MIMSTTQILRYQDKVVSGYLVNDEGQIFSTQGYKRIPVSYFLKNGTYYFKLVINGKLKDVPAIPLILSNFIKKPVDFVSAARMKNNGLEVKNPLALTNLHWVKIDSTKSIKTKKSVDQNDMKQMKQIFVSGVLTSLRISEQGVVFNNAGKEVSPKISRFGKPYFEINMPFNMGIRSVNLVDIVAETFHLPKNHSLINYHISYLDKNKKNCSKHNIILWPEGHSGIACKKAVKVMKDGKFFGVFDSVKMCSKIIDIPRRRVSELIKYGSEKNGFEVQPISIF